MINMLTTPYQLWNESPESINLDLFPMLPFGSIVMAHVPVHLQFSLHPKRIRMIMLWDTFI